MLSRRGFLKSTLGAGLGLATQGCQQMVAQPVRRRTIVDSQVHLWKAESADWPWVPGLKPQMPEPFTIEKLIPMMDEAGVDRVLIVPPSWTGDRNDYGLEAAKRYPNRFAVMDRIALQDPKSAALLPKWKEQPGMLGVRLTFNSPTATGWLKDGTADWFWPAAEKAGIPVMFLAPENVLMFARIAERHPQLTLILDHIGLTVDMAKEKTISTAIDQAVALAKYPNVSVKMKAGPQHSIEPYPYRDLIPHFRRTFEAFGPQRCYWETDMTNTFTRATYRQRITHFTEELSFLSESDKDWVMGRAILERLKWA